MEYFVNVCMHKLLHFLYMSEIVRNSGGENNCVGFQGKCNHCGKYGLKEAQRWVKHGKPNTDDQSNQATKEVHEEEVAVAGWCIEEDDMDYDWNDDPQVNNNEANEENEEDQEAQRTNELETEAIVMVDK